MGSLIFLKNLTIVRMENHIYPRPPTLVHPATNMNEHLTNLTGPETELMFLQEDNLTM